ncbi:Uncharacterized protein BP5553_00074 [Venustampulla echinocandica]|uniref:Rhodopsin domain-containing protein n=1 Tax=Venustampulla echinocandica TaxID=2656787 RepID=A0A370TX44_9HELO|nr:Uncharacterized protein BP5553_00074 [Venustampulla echinocandica]RDL40095.1 Uncharacterized protein BP5553_00074 [Venustampulla echinocandica]
MPSLNIDPSLLPLLVDLPAGTPPKGVEANFENPFTLAPLVHSIGSIFVFIMLCFVTARFYYKIFLIRRYTWDDLTCLIATLGTIEQLITASIISKAGAGTHQWDLKIGQIITNDFLIGGAAFVVSTLPTMMFAKLTFFIFYLQIFRPRPALARWIWAGALVSTGFYIATSIVQFYYLIPGAGQTWISKIDLNPNSPSATVGIVTACFGMASDFYLFFLAAAGIWQLQMQKERKLGIIGVFATGLLACIVSIVALIYRLQSKNGLDGTYQLLRPILLIIIELAVGVSCSCMPSVGNLTKRYSKQFSGLTSYFSLLRSRTYRRGSSRDERSQPEEYSGLRGTGDSNIHVDQSAQYSKLEGGELMQLQPVVTSGNRSRKWEMEAAVINVQQDVLQTREPRPVHDSRK